MKTTSQCQSQSHKVKSLIYLLDEPDEHLYINIANAIVAYGRQTLPLLKEKLGQTTDSYLKERIECLIDVIERQSVINRLNLWHDKREYDLLEPYFILSKYIKSLWRGFFISAGFLSFRGKRKMRPSRCKWRW